MRLLDYITEKFAITLRYHSRLNSKMWHNTQLNDGIAEKVLEQALAYAKFCKIPKERIKDVVITGGNVGYNFTKFSDVDAHVLVDLSGLSAERFQNKQFEYKKKWQDSHSVTIAGYPLEVFAANADEKIPDGQGVYSVLHNKWVIVPEHQDWKSIVSNPFFLSKMHHTYDTAEQLAVDGSKEEIEEFSNKLWKGRGAGLQRGGEFSYENLIFKNLRNLGTLDKLKKRANSLGENVDKPD